VRRAAVANQNLHHAIYNFPLRREAKPTRNGSRYFGHFGPADSSTEVLAAQILLSKAYDLKDQAALLQSQQTALQSGAVDTDTLEKTVDISSKANDEITTQQNKQTALTAQEKDYYAQSLPHFAKGVVGTRDMVAQAQKFTTTAKGSMTGLSALRLAVEQVNGKRVDGGPLQLNGNVGNGDVISTAYANWVASATSGAVTHFQLLSQKQVNVPTSTDKQSLKASQGASWNRGNVDASASANASAGDASASVNEGVKGAWDQKQGASQVDYQGKHTDLTSQWEVHIGADVATYREAASAKLTRVVVALPQVREATFRVGDTAIPSDSITSEIRSKIAEALNQTHRFTVLDRDADAQISQEIGLIQSGNATAKVDCCRLRGHHPKLIASAARTVSG
jgi:hypothetical protein